MRIVHVIPSYVPSITRGGPGIAVDALTRALAARGHDVEVLTTDVDTPAEIPRGQPVARDGVTVRYFQHRGSNRLHYAPELAAAARAEAGRTDVAHLHSVFLWPTAAAARRFAAARVPYVVAPRGMLVPELVAARGTLRKRAWIRLVERRTLRGAAAIHATSELEARDLARAGLDLAPVRVIPNGVELAAWDGSSASLPSEVRLAVDGPPYALFLGRLSWKKGLEALVDALAFHPLRLIVAGPDEDSLAAELATRAARAGASERLRFLGTVEGAAKTALLRRCVALALVSRSENFGNVVLEAMAAGRPVVVGPGVGLAELVAEHGAGVVTEPEPAAIAAALRSLDAEPSLAEAMGRRGRAVAEDLSWARVAERAEHLYREVLARRPT